MSLLVTRPDGERFAFDVVTSSPHEHQVNVTEHPLESGRIISDHAQALPRAFSVSAVMTETPFLTSEFLREEEGRVTVLEQRVEAAIAFLVRCKEERLVVKLPWVEQRNCMLLSFAYEYTKKGSVVFEIAFRVVEVATQEIVLLERMKPKARAGMPTEDDVGEQEKVPVKPGSKEELQLKSELAKGADGEGLLGAVGQKAKALLNGGS